MQSSHLGVGIVPRLRSFLAVRVETPLPACVEAARVFLLGVRVKAPFGVEVEIPTVAHGVAIQTSSPIHLETYFPSTNRSNPRKILCPSTFSAARPRHLRGTFAHALAQGLALDCLLALASPNAMSRRPFSSHATHTTQGSSSEALANQLRRIVLTLHGAS